MPQSSPPFYGSSGYGSSGSPSGSAPTNGSPQRMALDNIIRRELRVSDPSDPNQIAQALLTRYQDTPRAQAISQEAKGLPFLQAAPMQALVPQAATSSDSELQQAKDDVERDLQHLTTNALLKDVIPELQGWAQAVRSAITEGTTAARFALDPRQRDKAFGIRRQLGDYARMARLVGALTPTLSINYRKFAQSLDEVAAVILVTMGEALANVGFNGGRFLLQAPYSELQSRRDAAIYALRNLIGSTQEAYGPNDWPRGLDAYRSLFDVLEAQGQGDLRALLVEAELARSMDELIQRSAHGTVAGLRALGSTAQLDLERFRRLIIVGSRAVAIESPPLTTFLEALQLFTDAFESSGGFRLTRIARPPILFYGLYGTTVLEDADQRLLQLIIQRGVLADQLDCFLNCGCGPNEVICQILLDKILYDVDRAIDLYALGKEDFGQPERRAAAYSYVIDFFGQLSITSIVNQPQPFGTLCLPEDSRPGTVPFTIREILTGASGTPRHPGIIKLLRPDLSRTDPGLLRARAELVGFATLVRTSLETATLCSISGSFSGAEDSLCTAIGAAITTLNSAPAILENWTKLFGLAQHGAALLAQNNIIPPSLPDSVRDFLGILQQELCIQEDMEAGWTNLVKSMAPDCNNIDGVFTIIKQMIEGAIGLVSGVACPTFEPDIPPHFETSLEALVKTPRQ